jgi:hypothetical protein
VSLLTSPFVVGLAAFYLLLALPGPFLARLVLCAGLVMGCMAWRRRDRATPLVSETLRAGEGGWPEDDTAAAEPTPAGEPGWTVTRPQTPGRPAAATEAAAALTDGTGELQLVAVLSNRAGQRAELHLAPGMATLPIAVLARQAAGLLAAEQGESGWRLELVEVVDPARTSQATGPGAQAPWGWGG